MKVTIELVAGPRGHSPTKADMEKNIEALQRAIDGNPRCSDFILLSDTKSILVGIQKLLAR